jgi:hypothetical protein
MTAVVIKFERPAQRQAALGVELPIFLAPTVEGFRQKLYSDAFFELPFVTLPSEECASWGEFWERANMWNDEPTGDSCADCQRGHRYALASIDTIRKENASSRGLEIVVERMIERAFRRRGPKGALCRKLSSAEQSFLEELCKIAVYGWGEGKTNG